MNQSAIVKKEIREGLAEVSLLRQVECGLSCGGNCASCMQKPQGEILALASNPIGARPGQKVVVESSTKNMLRIVVLVYLIPVVLFLAGYVIMSLLTDSVAAQYAVAAAGFAAGIVFAIFYDRRLRARGGLTFNIVRVF